MSSPGRPGVLGWDGKPYNAGLLINGPIIIPPEPGFWERVERAWQRDPIQTIGYALEGVGIVALGVLVTIGTGGFAGFGIGGAIVAVVGGAVLIVGTAGAVTPLVGVGLLKLAVGTGLFVGGMTTGGLLLSGATPAQAGLAGAMTGTAMGAATLTTGMAFSVVGGPLGLGTVGGSAAAPGVMIGAPAVTGWQALAATGIAGAFGAYLGTHAYFQTEGLWLGRPSAESLALAETQAKIMAGVAFAAPWAVAGARAMWIKGKDVLAYSLPALSRVAQAARRLWVPVRLLTRGLPATWPEFRTATGGLYTGTSGRGGWMSVAARDWARYQQVLSFAYRPLALAQNIGYAHPWVRYTVDFGFGYGLGRLEGAPVQPLVVRSPARLVGYFAGKGHRAYWPYLDESLDRLFGLADPRTGGQR